MSELRERIDRLSEPSNQATDSWDPASHLGPIQRHDTATRAIAEAWLDSHRAQLDWVYARLCDDDSRTVLAKILAHRVAGSAVVATGVGRRLSRAANNLVLSGLRTPPEGDGPAPYFELEPLGSELRLYAAPGFVVGTFVLEQYDHPCIAEARVRAGDVAVDGGGFWGDTALWLADRVGPGGQVICFEPDPHSLTILERNLASNPEPAARIALRREALWQDDRQLSLSSAGAASQVDPHGATVETAAVTGVSFDALIDAGEVPEPDFIKLDIEGAELPAIDGASATLGRRGPRLAVAAYHRWEDIIELPMALHRIRPAYRIALSHQSVHQFDFVLFAF